MSVYIRGMEMPKRCWDCDLCYDSFYCRAIEVQFSDREDFEPGERRLSDCPLVPVPKHGRLGDLDTLQKQIDFARNCGMIGKTAHYKLQKLIKEAPTITPADEVV